MEISVSAALRYFMNYLRTHVLITCDESREDSFFWKGAATRADQLGMAHIGLPHASNFMWISNLDASSLNGTVSLIFSVLSFVALGYILTIIASLGQNPIGNTRACSPEIFWLVDQTSQLPPKSGLFWTFPFSHN
jgi:hypothetical protein